MINILQLELGPLDLHIASYVNSRKSDKTLAGVDINPNLKNKSLYEISGELSKNVMIYSSVKDALDSLSTKPDVAIIITVSSLEKIIVQIKDVARFGIPVLSTCEELSYPWDLQPELSRQLDSICKEDQIESTLRHVGLQESVYFLANSADFNLEDVTESLDSVIAEKDINAKSMTIKKGKASGVEQIANSYVNGKCKIKMHFKASICEKRSYDKITIKDKPSFSSLIEGGLNGDFATCAMTVNSIKPLLKAPAGLHTLSDLTTHGFIS
jgi:hypothetical protein